MAAGAGYARYDLNGNKVVIIYDIGSYIMFFTRNNVTSNSLRYYVKNIIT